MVRSLLLACCALLCLFVLGARSEVNVPWPPSSLPECSAPWDRYGDAYDFCHVTLTGAHTSAEWDGWSVSDVEIEPCNWDYFLLDASSYGDLQVGDWLQVSIDYGVASAGTDSLDLLVSYTGLPPTSITNDGEFAANNSFSISPWTLSTYPQIWIGVGHYRRTGDTAPGFYDLSIERFRPWQECEECLCDPEWGYTEIPLSSSTDDQVVLTGSLSYSNDTRPDFDATVDVTYALLRNFHFNVPSSAYRPGAYLDINITILDDSTGATNAYLSAGPYAVDPKSSDYYSEAISLNDCGICPNGLEIAGTNCHLYLTPCDFYYGDYYLSIEFDDFCPVGASYEITVNVMAPVVQALTLTGSPSAVSFSNNLQTNIFLGAQAGYSQYDHYVLTVSGITNRTHAFARLTSVYGYNMGLFMRSSDQASGAVIAYEDRDRVLVPREFNGNATCDDSCYNVDYFCQTTDSSIGQVCGCSFLVRSCDLEETDYYLSVVPFDNSEAFVDVQSYHIEVSTYEDNLQATLVPGQPISTTLAVWSPFQIYVFATPNTVDTWAVFELFVRAPSTATNQLAQPGLTLDLLQNFASINDAFVCSDAETTALQTCTTSSLFYTAEEAPSPDGISVPGSCHLTVDACKLNYGAVYLSVYPDSADISSYGINGGQWDYVLWGDLETAWALESDVTYTDRVRVNQYNHYYIDVDDSIEAGSWLSVDFEFLTPLNTASFISYLNYESLAGDCPCYENLDSCLLSSGTATAESCDSAAESCNTDVNGWSSDYGYDLADNSYPVITENSGGACRVQATVCAFRPGRWFVSTTAVYSSGGSGGKSVVPENAITAGSQPVDSSNSVNLVGYSMTARIHSAPVVNELEFNTLVTELLTPSEILHFQLTQIDAPGDDLVVTVNWYSEILSRFYAAQAGSSDSSYTLPKAIFQDWGIELRLNFGDLAFDECYEHPWSCKAYALNGGSCQIIVPACKWAVVDPQQIFVSARYNRGYFDSEYFPGLLGESDYSDYLIEPLDVLAPQLWVGDAQINLQVTSERAEVTSLAIGSPIYGSVLADRYAHYSFQLLSTQALRTDIDVYFFVQSSFDLSETYPIVALNSGSLAGNGRGCRDCFSVVQSCQNNINCHWTFDSCNGLSTDTTYYLSVYKPVNAFFNQALEFSVLVSQQELIIPVSLGAANRLTSTIVLQDSLQTRAFFAIDGSSLPERATPLDYLSIRIWNSGIVSSDFTYYLNHDSLAGSCECFGARCQESVSLSNECPITASSGNYIEIVDNDLTAGTYFLTLEFASVDGSDAVVLTIEAEAVIYDVVARTPTNLRESGTEFYLGNANLRYGEDITLDYNEGYNMDNWLVFDDNIDWDETNNVIRNEKIYGVSIPSVYGLETPARFSDGSLATKFYAITVTNPATEPGHVLPDRVFLGIDNIRSDIDNCYTVGKGELTVSWYGTQEQALSSVLSNVNNNGRTCAINTPLASTIGQTTASADSQLLFTELPVCLFTHAQTATHLFAVTFSPAENDAWSLSLADGASNEEIFPAVIYDIRFFLQKPIAMQDLDAFYVGPSYLTETVGYPYTTNWQPLQNAQLTGLPSAFKQRFSLDLSGTANLANSLVQVVIETDDELFVTVNGDYAPNFNNAEGCWVDSCTSRSLLEFREATLSYLQLNTAAFGDSVVSAAANNTLNFADPDANLVYTCAPPSCVFTLDPCALSQSSLWYFDIVSANGNSSFAIYYTAPESLLTDIYDISATDIEERNWVPGTDATFGGVDGVDNYEFFRISNEVLTEVLSGEGRARLEIQIEWQTKTTTEDFANDQWASIVISPEAPVYVRGQQGLGSNAGFTGFPFYTSRGQTNVAYTESVLPSISTDQFLYNTYESDIPFCFEPFYISVSGGAYNNTNTGASGSERLFLDGCDLQGISELWLTARMLTPGSFDYQYLVRVVRDKEIDLTDLTIGSGYANAATNLIASDTVTAIEPNSFNHNKFLLPTDLQTGSASTLIVELFFPDDSIDRNNGTFWLLFSADAPAGWASIYTPDSYVTSTDARYPVYVGLPTFGAQASFGSDDSTVGAQTNYDCYSNLVDYSADAIIFNDDDTGLVPVDNFANEYRSRRSIDLFNFRYATYLYVSVFYEGVWEPTFPDSETETELWQGYELNVWIQPEPSASSPFIINQNISTEQVCFDGLDGVTTDTGIYPNEAGFDLNISWAGSKSLTPTWFTFELDESLISLDCSLSASTPECYFTQYLEFQIFNDDFLQDYTFNGSPTIALDGDFTVFGPGSISIGGANDFETASSNSDIFGGKWIVQDSHLASDHRFFASPLYLDLNASSPAIQFGPCSSPDKGYSYLPDRDWNFGEAFAAPQGFYTLRPGTYYIPVWSADSLDFTICATLNSIGYDYTWTTVTSPYEPQELTAYDTDDVDSSVVTLAQAVVDWNNETTARYDYYWFSLSDADIASSEQYLQIWLDRVAVCTGFVNATCTALPENDDLILQMFRSDCQLWSCDANGEGAGCEGRWTTGSSNEDGDYGVVSRFILGGAGLSPCSLTAGDFFIKVNLPQAATYTLSAYLRTPPTVVSLTEAVAVRSTIYSTAFQHYVFTAADSSSSLLTSLSVSLTEVLCGSLEMFAKHGTPAGPFYPTNLDAITFIGSQMYYPSQSLFDETRFAGSSLEKCASAYCAADGETSCTINIGTTELSKDLDATGLIGSTTWYFAVRSISTKYHTDNDASNGGDLPWDVSDSTEGNGFNEPTTYFITATTTYSDLFTSQSIGCSVTPATSAGDVCSGETTTSNDNAQIYQFGFQTITLFTNALVDSPTVPYSVNATVHASFAAVDGVNQFVEPIELETGTWSYELSAFTDLSVVGPKNVFYDLTTGGTVFADFYHHPVTPLLPGVTYSSTGFSPSGLATSSSFLTADHIYYEFSPALTSTPSFSLTYINTDGENCLHPRFWTETDCGVYTSARPDDNDFFTSCGVLPRFFSFYLDEACSSSCSTGSCDTPFQWEFSYSTSLPITELDLGVVSCGSSWETTLITGELSGSTSHYWLLFSLPTTPDFDGTTANWLSLDFYPNLADSIDSSDILFFESSSFTCGVSQETERDSSFDIQNGFVCPSFGYLAARTNVFSLDYSESSVTPSLFSIPVIASDLSLSSATGVSSVSIPIASTDLALFDYDSAFAIYSFTVPAIDSSVSWLTVAVDSGSCGAVSSWLNFGTPVPAGCDDVAWSLLPCQVNSGVYYVSVRADLASSAYYPEWAGSITVTLKTDAVLDVPAEGNFSASYTIDAGASVILQTSLPSEWLKSHPALQSEIIYRVISPLGIWTLDVDFNSEPSLNCFDCQVPVVSTELTNNFDAPFTFTVQFELVTDLLYLIDPDMFWIAPAKQTYIDISTAEPVWDKTFAFPLLTPYLDQRAATVNTLALGVSVSPQLYNAFTSRQIQVYVVDIVTANSLAQLRVANVVGGVVSMQVFAATLDRSCGEFKECHSAPIQWSQNHQLLQASPLNNIAGSCSVVYNPCEWAASPSWFVVLNDHVLNNPQANLEIFTSPLNFYGTDGFNFTYSSENSTLTNPPFWNQMSGDYVPSQNNPFVAVTFDLIVTEESWTALNATPSASQSFLAQESTPRSVDNPAGNWQHFFYSYEASGVTSVRIIVDVSAASALATSGVWVTVTDSDCGCGHLFRNVWCSAEYPSWLCEIEVALHAEHPLESTTFYVDVYGLKGSFTVAATEGVDGNCVSSDGESFCPTRVLNYPFWPSLDSSDLDNKASCLYDELLSFFESPCDGCFDVIGNDCQLALMDYACAATFQPCDVNGFIDASICVDKCTAVESACPFSFVQAGLPNLDCGHARYSTSNCF